MSAGGGSKRLFRKVADRSSEFYPKINDIRREGSFLYEEFLNTQGVDVKVYTVGPNYGHAQARKSPVVDGRVMRDCNGKEMHLPVILTPQEKEFSMKITRAFKQTVCGFDLLRCVRLFHPPSSLSLSLSCVRRRVAGRSYVCDVNGWSFVKSSRKYYDDCARVLNELMLKVFRTHHHASLLAPSTRRRMISPLDRSSSAPLLPSSQSTSPNSRFRYERQLIEEKQQPLSPDAYSSEPGVEDSDTDPSPDPGSEEDEELLCVISVIRHGDRTPKQKIKIKLDSERFLGFYHRNSNTSSPVNTSIKLKSKSVLLEFLELVREELLEMERNSEQHVDPDLYGKLCCVRDVLESREIHGLTRKIQLKPEKWSEATSRSFSDDDQLDQLLFVPRVTEVLCVVKWGGDLTPLGEQQAERVGESFRQTMYPDPSGGGILRLHSTFRHDLKIKASDEGRVMKTAAAFTKGLLELEGDLTPVLVSLVTVQEKNTLMLDHHDNSEVKTDLDSCKTFLNQFLQKEVVMTSETISELLPHCEAVLKQNLCKLGNPKERLRKMHALIKEVCEGVKQLEHENTSQDSSCDAPEHHHQPLESPVTTTTTLSTSSDSFPNSTLIQESNPPLLPSLNETYALMLDRWLKLDHSFFKQKQGLYDLSKVPELHDMARYDVLHNHHLTPQLNERLVELYAISKLFADCVVPQEYGISEHEKRSIGRKMCHALIHKIQYDLMIAQSGSDVDMQCMLDESHGRDLNIHCLHRCIRTRLYFTSESHLYTLFHVLGYPSSSSSTPPSPLSPYSSSSSFFHPDETRLRHNACELSYLSQITIRLFENKLKPQSDPERYRCEILLSPGAISDPCEDKMAQVAPQVVLNSHINCRDLIAYFHEAIAGYETTFLPRAKSDGESDMMFC
jgi:inositol-hexakisphosphate/diphosphoinositol-pentakisphosphate 1-kinase